MARSARSTVARPSEDHDEIIDWYRRRLTAPAEIPSRSWEPVVLGPTWRRDEHGRWLLPDRTLGWHVLGWCGSWLQHGRGKPWRFTDEQARFTLWWYELDDAGRFAHRDGVLQRLKGWGKDPVGATYCAVEMLGPCRFDEWGVDDEPVARDVEDAWVQTAATALEQTKNTMRLFPGLFTPEAKAFYGIQVGKEQVHAVNGSRLIQAVTSSPATLEGARATFVLKNETHHWLANNDGHEMAAVIERNATKSADGAARTLAITNAYEPGENSVAERDRDAYEKAAAGQVASTGLLYDSLEAPPAAPLSAEAAPEVVWSISGDSTWLDADRIVQSILDVRNPPSRSRRFWYNQITAAEDAWLSRQEWDACADTTKLIADGDLVTLGFDGSLADDHTALIACSIELDHFEAVKVWVPGADGVDRGDIDLEVRRAFDRWDVVGFFGDLHPFESYIDRWAEELGGTLCVKASPKHPVAWDMRSKTQAFTQACERLHAAILERQVTHDGSGAMAQHFYNARRRPNQWGVSVGKEHRESSRKIDSVPAAVLARLARQEYLALPRSRQRRKRTGKAVFF